MAAGYVEHLSDNDLWLLADAAGLEGTRADVLRRLRADAQLTEPLLVHPAAHDRLFGAAAERDPFLIASPFLVFAVILHRAARELDQTTFLYEWVQPRRRLPVYDVEPLRSFLGDGRRRLFLVELLASYTRVTSGALWIHSPRGWRRQRFSDLDPVRFASLLDVVSDEERPGIYRRLGDLALFLTGVFPDRSADLVLRWSDAQRLLRAGPRPHPRAAAARTATGGGEEFEGLGLLEELGERWYRLACAEAPSTRAMEVVASVAERFRVARRILNFVTDQHLFVHRARWFPGSRA